MTLQTSNSPEDPPSADNFDRDRFCRHFRHMVRVRAFEETAIAALRQGLVHGAIHPSIGQEAVAAGICGNLDARDILLSNHRGHGHALVKGADPTAMMCELFGRAAGVCHGKGGSMHIADFGVGMLGTNDVVGANILIAAGAAHAIKLKGETGIVACIFGDGAINRGPFLEGLNWAVVYRLPVLFVCEDNEFAATTRTASLTAGAGGAARARALDIPAQQVDGNDILATDAAARKLIAGVKNGNGPGFLLAKTYRLAGHTADDAGLYRSEAEVAARWREEPIARCRRLLQDNGVSVAQLDTWEKEDKALMQRAFIKAKAAPWPSVGSAYSDVEDIGDPRRRAY